MLIDIVAIVTESGMFVSLGRPGAGEPLMLCPIKRPTAPAAWALTAFCSPVQLPRFTSAMAPVTLVVNGSQPSSGEVPVPSLAARTVAVRS